MKKWRVRSEEWRVMVALALLLALMGCSRPETVVVYTSQDEVYAEPILQEFTRQTGIKTLAVYDSEAVKTVGLVNRLLTEKDHPQCDVFWNNEELRTHQLEKQGVLRETNGWVAFGFRTRRLVVNTNLMALTNAPRRLSALTNDTFRGRVAVAYPLFGTTSTHFLALRQRWGEVAWEQWCRALAANKPFLVDGNSVVVKMVAKGEAVVGISDSDDVIAGQREGLPVDSLILDPDGLAIRNTVAVIRRAPHPEAAQKLLDYLQSDEVFKKLVEAGAVEVVSPNRDDHLQWEDLLKNQERAVDILKKVFLR